VPLLARMLASPLAVDIRRGAVAGLGRLLADGRISAGGKVAVVVGRGQGEEIAGILGPQLRDATVLPVSNASVEHAREIAVSLRQGSYDAVVGIGGGRTLDVAKYVASLVALPMVSVATNLAHDGIASPVASLEYEGRKGSYGVHIPIAVFVDLDYVRRAPARMVRSGIGDAVSNLSAISDWQLAADERGEAVDGLAVAFARTAAEAVVHRTDGIESLDFLTTLAEALVLSGLAMAVAGSSRPCSGGDHEILHAVDQLFPGVSNHGELAGLGGLFCAYLREDQQQFALVAQALQRHALPRTPNDVGLSTEQFAEAVAFAPQTRPDRYTILEHLALSPEQLACRVAGYVEAVSG
jgi:glycerol-1-phosphate dehydrogenase [NAD(P)+]